ncbi:brain-specific angiogenesis inhibitor 1-associated protein 2-like [Sinocyclocheilus anshuiensis]|uniref:brain-specific angiogenesis inhibitor 1-associated protein 2-like n=1 Tax=Sinocyclocheilus anshuiensis TaxID=1608454 RepID=UPI0007BA01F6|nr:PREDICTED: brain-specific angiogenesis inhibitor 1-associated protein 2-like [Sinocyclocheilus anshuiensis]
MSRSDEVNKMTENVYKGILEQFNPSLKNFVTMGKHYEKALTGVTVAAKGYFDALVKLGELASDSQGSKELGDTLFQMAEVHRQIQVQLEDVLKLFHSELLSQLEQKLELDIKYLTATLKKYQSERKSKVESIERCQSQLKKLRRKSQASRHPNKYGDREMQYVELMSRRQGELDSLVAVGYRSALTEERRRYCFLVDRQCSVTKILTNYHCKVRELLSQKLSSWQQSCAQPTKLPERALSLLRHTAPQSSGGAGLAEVLRNAKLGITQHGEQRLSVQEVPPLLNGDSSSRPQQQQSHQNPSSNGQAHSSASPAHFQPTVGVSGCQSPPTVSHTPSSAHSTPLSRALSSCPAAPDLYSTSTLPLPRRQSSDTRQGLMGSTLPRVLPLCAPSRVEALFPHSPDSCEAEKPGDRGGSSCLLSFLPGDALSLLISEPRDGWHYGQNERTGRKGWFPFSYTQPFPNTPGQDLSPPALSKVNSSSMGQLDRLPPAGQMPQVCPDSEDERSVLSQRISTFRPRPYSMMNPETSRMRTSTDFTSTPPSPSRINPFAHIRLKKTVTNDRSAPLIQQSL